MRTPDSNPTQGFKATDHQLAPTWADEESYWRDNWHARPYALADRGFDAYRPGYHYGYESAQRYGGREWNDVESDLRTDWDRYEHRGDTTWNDIKHAVRDAWDRVRHPR